MDTMEKAGIVIGKEFSPSPALRTLYFVYFLSILIIAGLPWMIPIVLFAPPVVTMVLLAVALPIILFAVYWIPKFYGTMNYRLTKDDMTWRRGVWFKNTGIVPYNRITNVDIIQGPVSRHFGIASLKIQTAGYSGPNQRSSEIRLEGIEMFEEMRETLMDFVRGRKPVAVEAYDDHEENIKGSDVLKELVRIRKLLEKKR